MALYIPHSIFHLARLLLCQAGNVLDPTTYHKTVNLKVKVGFMHSSLLKKLVELQAYF